MADVTESTPAPSRMGLKPLLVGAALAVAAGGGGFAVVHVGLADGVIPAMTGARSGGPDIAFVELPTFLVSLGPLSESRTLRFAATLEVDPDRRAEVERLMPRLADVLNGYLRAVEPEEFGTPGALIRLRAQMLRRVQVVTGEGRVRDLLVTEFVVN